VNKYYHMIYMGAFMTGGIGFVKATGDLSMFERITMSLIMAVLGGAVGGLIALLVWLSDRRKARHGRLLH